jgi:hypothetical protein
MSGGDQCCRLSVGKPSLVGLRYGNGDVSLLLEVEFHGAGFHGRGFVRKTVSRLPWLCAIEVIALEFTPACENSSNHDVEQEIARRCSEFEVPFLPCPRDPR